jgi:hypothetical protein
MQQQAGSKQREGRLRQIPSVTLPCFLERPLFLPLYLGDITKKDDAPRGLFVRIRSLGYQGSKAAAMRASTRSRDSRNARKACPSAAK